MNTITYAQVQELVTQIPIVKLPIAYQLLTELASHRVDKSSPQLEFILLSSDSQRRLFGTTSSGTSRSLRTDSRGTQ
jgi:hypothetical protein